MATYRKTDSAYVCAPTNHFADLTALQNIVKRYKSEVGGKVPPQVEAALEAAATGGNVEQSLNLACDGLFKFYIAQETRCAKEAGFATLEEFEQQRGIRHQQVSEIYDPCIAGVVRQWPLTNINYTINLLNPDSAVREFIRRTRDQVFGIASKYVKKKVLDKAKGKPPPYEKAPAP